MEIKNKKVLTAALVLSNAMAGLDTNIVNTALPAIISDLKGINYIGWIIISYLLMNAVTTPLWSKVGEHIGYIRAYIIATTLFGIGSFLQGIAPSMLFLVFGRAIMGIGGGGMLSVPFVLYTYLYTNPITRARVLGLASAMYATFSLIGPLLGGFLVDNLSWHWVFFINIPFSLVSALVVFLFTKGRPAQISSTPVDWKGALTLTLGISSLLMATQEIGQVSSLVIVGFLLLAIVLLYLFVQQEKRHEDPIIPLYLFKEYNLLVDFVLLGFLWGAGNSFMIYVPMWAQGVLATSALLGGATQIPSSIFNFVGAGTSANLMKKFGLNLSILIGIGSLTIADLLLIIFGQATPYWIFMVSSVFFGFGMGISFSLFQIKTQEDAPKKDVGIATSLSFLIRVLGSAISAAIFAAMLTQGLDNGVEKSTSPITSGMLDQLTNAKAATALPQQYLPELRHILFDSIYNIQLVGFVITLGGFFYMIYYIKKFKTLNAKSEN